MTFKLGYVKPQLIIADGINGCGKTSLIDALQDKLDQEGIQSVKIPMVGAPIRDLALGDHDLSHRQLAMLLRISSLSAGAAVKLATANGKWVLMDRGPASYYAYQGVAAGEALFIANLDRVLATPFPMADFSIFLDVPYDVAMRRQTGRNIKGKPVDRFEDIGNDFELLAQAGFRDYFNGSNALSTGEVIQISDDLPVGFLSGMIFDDIVGRLKASWDAFINVKGNHA